MDMHASDSFSVAFDFASGATGERFQNPLWPIMEPLFGKRFRNSLKIVKRFGNDILDHAVHLRKQNAVKGESPEKDEPSTSEDRVDSISGSLINSLLDSIDDHQIVADAALNYLSAGMYCIILAGT